MAFIDITLNKIVDIIKEAADCHVMLNDFHVGEESAQGYNDESKSELEYPYLWVDFAPSNYTVSNQKIIQDKVYNIVLFVADKQFDNIKNDVEILSDTESILCDVIQYILTHPNFKQFTSPVGSITINPGRDGTKDGVFGWTATFPIRVRYSQCHNTLPIPCNIIPSAPPDGGAGVIPTGNYYRRSTLSDQTTSYAVGDDGWHLANGTFDYVGPANPATISQLDHAAANPFLTLRQVNSFATLDRFTDSVGGQNYDGTGGSLTDYIIDHLTGLGWFRIKQPTQFWAQQVAAANASTILGFTDWRLPTRKEFEDIMRNRQGAVCTSYSPFNLSGTGATTDELWTGTTQNQASTRAYCYRPATDSIDRFVKLTVSRPAIFCRNHYN